MTVLSDHCFQPSLLFAHVKDNEVGPRTERPAFSVSVPAQAMHALLSFAGVKHADLSPYRVVQGSAYVSSSGQLILNLHTVA